MHIFQNAEWIIFCVFIKNKLCKHFLRYYKQIFGISVLPFAIDCQYLQYHWWIYCLGQLIN